MASKRKRDYKREYQLSKQRAQRAGYKSEREYKTVRKALALPPRTSPIPKRVLDRQPNAIPRRDNRLSRLRAESRDWSNRHSHTVRSQYSDNMSDEQVEKYHHAYVEPILSGSRRGKAREKRRRIKAYLVPDWVTETEWDQKYNPV